MKRKSKIKKKDIKKVPVVGSNLGRKIQSPAPYPLATEADDAISQIVNYKPRNYHFDDAIILRFVCTSVPVTFCNHAAGTIPKRSLLQLLACNAATKT